MKSKWLSRNDRDYWCCEFSRFGSDHAALANEIAACREVIQSQPDHSLPVAIDLYDAPMTPELVAFFSDYAAADPSPVRRMAVIGVSRSKGLWYRLKFGIVWPKSTRLFLDWEAAKDWLVAERF